MIKNQNGIKNMKQAGLIVYLTHQYLKPYIKPGITTKELDKLAEDFIRSKDATPSFKGLYDFPASICTSSNDEVVHGIPSDYKLRNGDIIKIDIGACYRGYHGDSAWTYVVGKPTKDQTYLLKHTEQALYQGINQVKPDNTIKDIAKAIEDYALKHNLGIVKELVGHGIGKKVHEPPDVPNYVRPKTNIKLKPGMTIAIEPMLNLGGSDVNFEDKWTIKTKDGSLSAHFEHTVLVTETGYQILTGKEEING